jgi:trigger factor
VQSRVVEVGSQTFPPPFEERLVGAKRGETVRIEVSYPAEHHSSEIAGKTVTFRVDVKEIGRKEIPALDDDFAKDHGECGSLAELRAKVRANLEAAAGREADEQVRGALLSQLVERNPIDVPDALVESRFDAMLHEVGLHGADSHGNPEMAAKLDELRTQLRQRARQAVHSSLLLERLAQQERLEVAEGEIDERVAQVVRAAPRERERLAEIYRTPEARREVAERIAQEKALAWLVEHAAVRDAPPQT